MKKNKKILLSTICASAASLAITPIAISLTKLDNNATSKQEIVNKDTQFWEGAGGNTLPIWSLRIEGKIVQSNDYKVSVQTRYYRDQPVYFVDETYWEMSWDNKEWKKISWLTEEQHKLEDFTFDRYTTGNYYVRKVIIWQHQTWWDPVFRTSQPLFIGRKLALSGTTQSTKDYVNYDFTFGVSSEKDLIKLTFVETDENFNQIYSVVDKTEWVLPEQIAKKSNKANDYLWSKKIMKQPTAKYYKLTLESINGEGIHQFNSAKIKVLESDYENVLMNIHKGKETNESASFNFNFDLKEGDLMSYKIVNVQPYGEVVKESKDYAPIESFATKTYFGYTFTRTYAKLFSSGKLNYKIYVNVRRGGGNTVSKGLYAFDINPRINPNDKQITTKLLHDENKLSIFLLLNGGYTRESIDKLNNASLWNKMVNFNNFLIQNPNLDAMLTEFKNIRIYLSKDNGSTITLGVVYELNKNYIFDDSISQLKQSFYEVKKL